MSMPKGHKIERGYATISDLGGMDYRSIANLMTENGFKMNHATARNVFLSGMSKIAKELLQTCDRQMSTEEIKSIAVNPTFQNAVCEIIFQNNQ